MKRSLIKLLFCAACLPTWLLGFASCPTFKEILRSSLLSQGTWGVEFDVLYWRPTTLHLLYASSFTPPVFVDFGTFYQPQSDYDIGYRAGGWRSFCHNSYYAATWVTWFTGRNSQSKLPLPDGLMEGFGGSPGSEVENATANLKVRYLAADIEFGRNFAADHCFCVSLFGGARYVDIYHKVEAFYTPNTTNNLVTFFHLHPRFHAVGPRLGIAGQWTFCRYWAVKFKTGFSMLFATRPTNLRVEQMLFGSINAGLGAEISNQNYGTWQVDTRVGLEWQITLWSNSSLRLEGGVAFEHTDDAMISFSSMASPMVVKGINFHPFNVGGPYGKVSCCF